MQIRQILATRALTLHRASQRSAQIFGRSSRFYLPHNLYGGLANPSLTPTIYQILALSHITNYRLSDWLAVFGFDLDAIVGLQFMIPRAQTIVLDSTIYDSYAWIPWFAERHQSGAIPSIAPLVHFLGWAAPRRVGDLPGPNGNNFVYARIGERDLYSRPYFVPGSIVRADTRRAEGRVLDNTERNPESDFFLVEHDFGWTCSRLIPLGKDRVLLHCPQRPCMERELHLRRNARILGVVDAEIRPVARHHAKREGAIPSHSRKLRLGRSTTGPTTLRTLLSRARIRAGMSFREASSTSRLIADMLADQLYFAAPGTLSDYEALDAPPRHIQKIITICVLYGIGFHVFLRAFGLPLDTAGQDPIPDELALRQAPHRSLHLPFAKPHGAQGPDGLLSTLLDQWGEVPLFLRFSLGEVTATKSLSLSDVFWIGGDQPLADPLLKSGALVVVNRRAKRPAPSDKEGVCETPFYLILRRDGEYVCGRCTLDGDMLVIRTPARSGARAQQFRNGIDAEIIGQVTAIARRFF